MDEAEFQTALSGMKRKVNSLAAKIKLACELGRKAMADKGQIHNFKGQFRTLDDNFEKFEDKWDEIVELCIAQGKTEAFPTQTDSVLKSNTERYYIDASASHSILTERPIEDSATRQTSTPSSRPSVFETSLLPSSSSFLPKINIPSFDGTLTKWPAYRDLFISLIHKDEAIPAMKKFHYLLSSLKGPAHALVSKLQIVETNYPLAWKALEEEYENPRLLATVYLNEVLNFQPASKVTKEFLTSFISNVVENISAFRLLKVPNEGDFALYYLAIRGLDPETRKQFELENQSEKFPSLDSLIKFVRGRLTALQFTESHSLSLASQQTPSVTSGTSKNQRTSKSKTSLMVNQLSSLDNGHHGDEPSPSGSKFAKSSQTPKCIVCSQSHSLSDCLRFIDATSQQRFNWLKPWKGCRNCLMYKHKTKDCRSKPQCRFCKLPHNSLLHLTPRSDISTTSTVPNLSQSPDKNTSPEDQPIRSSMNTISTTNSDVLLGTACAEIRDICGNFQPIRLVVDNGSQYSFITKRFVKRLRLEVSSVPKRIGTVGRSVFEGAKGKVTCHIRPKGKNEPVFSTDAIVLDEIVCDLPNFVLHSDICKEYMKFPLADDKFWQTGAIDFLLGCDLYPEISAGGVITIQDNWPKLFMSSLGYIVCGRIPEIPEASNAVVLSCTANFPTLQDELHNFWSIEEPCAPSTSASPEEIECESHFQSTHRRTDSGQYIVRLPFKSASPNLGDSSAMALRRFHNLERKLDRKSDLRLQYSSFMKEYLDLNHMSLTTDESRYLVPHHSIVKEDHLKTRLKVVFDCSASTKTGSLNDHLLVGPKLHRDIKDILNNFRTHQVVFVTDIVKMYRFILIDPRDRPYLHIFWRFDTSEAIDKYQLNTLTYGLSCAPFLALRVIKQLCLDEGHAFPKAAEVMMRDMYIDDLVTGASSVADALELQQQVIGLMSKGGFNLSKWSSNREELLQAVQEHSNSDPISLSAEEDLSVKILGLQWDPKHDSFTYNIKPPELVCSKRSFLSTVARIYDPLGFLSPVVVTAKGLIQDLWKASIDWDDPIPSEIADVWKDFIDQIPLLSNIRIPRFLFSSEPYQAQLLGFCDASEKAYSSAIYLRIATSTNVFVHLLVAKTKLAPLKTQSIPRLELMGALLLANTYASLSSFFHTLPAETPAPLLFTDSTVALGWINTPTYLLKTFIANRVNRINELTAPFYWRHISSGDNPSDVNSRGMLPAELPSCDLWWRGPQWLYLPPDQWPIRQPPLVELPEMRAPVVGQVLASTTDEHPLITWMSKFSSFMKLLRFFSWLRRWIDHKKNKSPMKKGPIQAGEILETELACIRFLQTHCFNLKQGDRLASLLPRFADLNPFVHRDGIVRVGGRIRKAELPFRQKHPILLPHCHFTSILLDHLHCIYLHPGPGLLQALVQLRYWVPSLRRLVRHRTFLCIKCFRANAQSKSLTPMMGDLPKHRLTGKRAFLHVGLDFAGPFFMRYSLQRKSSTSKAYLCLFICMGCKAVHLEAVTSLSTEAFLACLNRFVARRGLPEQLYSDCGTNFVGAANQMREFLKWYREEATRNNLIQFATSHGIHWNFNPPGAPHMGGIWEAGIKSAKTVISKMMGKAVLTFEELSTLFCQVEAVLNSRPLCPLSSSPEETDYLSPGHFLIGDNLLQNPQPSLLQVNENRLSRWQLVQSIFQHFWKRWHVEYISTLQRRLKWTKPEKNLEVNDLVIIKDPNIPPLQWPLARVTELHPGSDGVVRSVMLRTSSSSFQRPVVKLVPLLPLTFEPHDDL